MWVEANGARRRRLCGVCATRTVGPRVERGWRPTPGRGCSSGRCGCGRCNTGRPGASRCVQLLCRLACGASPLLRWPGEPAEGRPRRPMQRLLVLLRVLLRLWWWHAVLRCLLQLERRLLLLLCYVFQHIAVVVDLEGRAARAKGQQPQGRVNTTFSRAGATDARTVPKEQHTAATKAGRMRALARRSPARNAKALIWRRSNRACVRMPVRFGVRVCVSVRACPLQQPKSRTHACAHW